MFTPEIVSALGPSLAVVIVVVLFLGYLKKREDRLFAIFDRNTDALDNNSTVLGQTLEALRRINGK